MYKYKVLISIIILLATLLVNSNYAQTIALWAFDEQKGIYPSSVLTDLSDSDYPLVLGPGGMIVEGKFGNALQPTKQPAIKIFEHKNEERFGLVKIPAQDGRNQEPLTWFNANFAALMTSGEKHLRNQVGFAQVTKTKLNLGDFDWTIEFWFMPLKYATNEGVVFEIGTGPRGENNITTKLKLSADQQNFIFENQPFAKSIIIPTKLKIDQWQHLAFVYNPETKQISLYVDGVKQEAVELATIKKLPVGEEDYMSIGCDGLWNNPLPGKIDELRFSEALLYTANFNPPQSFSYINKLDRKINLKKGLPLLFDSPVKNKPIKIGTRKHLFIDDALLEKNKDLKFTANPPRPAEIVLTNIKGSFRKHLGVIEDDQGKIRLYTTVDDDYLAVWISDDGLNFRAPDLPNGHYKGHTNIVLHNKVGMGIVFIDPNSPPQERWKYISDYHRRAVSLFYSKDGLEFERYKQPVLPFRSGSQANIYYDDQKQVYTTFHRSDFGRTKSGDTQRDFVMTETRDLIKPWPFKALSQEEAIRRSKKKRTANLIPWYLDNGPLTPGGFAVEYPWIFSPDDDLDPRETDIYVPKVLKYPWAPDTYLAFPVIYFHYEESSPVTRVELMNPKRKRGSGPLETQLAVSRNGEEWKRFARPVYVGIGEHKGIDFKTSYIAHGMVKRGDEIWQYNFGEPHYHSPWQKFPEKRAVYRLVQRLDGFVSIDSPYDKEIEIISKPLVFEGNQLELNIDTDAAGYTQIGFLDDNNKPIEGFSVDDCIYINGDFIATKVEWMKNRNQVDQISSLDEEDHSTLSEKVITSSDISSLDGKIVRLVFRMRGSKLYAMQFLNK